MHDYKPKRALFWKASIVLLGIISLSSGLIKTPGFWTSYALDIAGPAWIYILLRGQYNSSNSTFLSIKFSPEMSLFLVIGICYIIEIMQYLNIYVAHFDLNDFVAYISMIIPFYLIDKQLIRHQDKKNTSHL